jgi:signal transduction histidine kinase
VQDVKGFAVDRPAAPVDLSRLAENVLRMVRLEAGPRGGAERRAQVEIDAQLEPQVFARVRGSRVSQVLTNLLINAAQASEGSPESLHESGEAPAAPGGASAGEIRLRTFREGSAACIEVSDTGPGVPSHLAERIFEPFYTTRAGTGGTGLGLWLARGIVEEEGGTIALSERPGGGAVFRVSLPAAAP